MFGYVKINKMDLTFREYDHYKSYYCGLCKCLKRNHGEISRLSLNFDITFLIVLLSSIYRPKSVVTDETCISSPIKRNKVLINEVTEYAASMNVLLTYYKLEDNVRDEGGIKNKLAYNIYKGKIKNAYEKYPDKAEYIKDQLQELDRLEKDGNINIDEVSNTFGYLMSEIFAYREDEYEERLRTVGFNIGKYIYILDAFEDLDEDIKKGSYNPFKEYVDRRDELRERVDKIIGFSLGLMGDAVDSLDIKVNRNILENIIYSGVYLRYRKILNKGNSEINQQKN
jgi:hypothetical protein